MNKIVPIDNSVSWSEAACLGAMLERANDLQGVLVLAYDCEGQLTWGAANMSRKDIVWALERYKNLILTGNDVD